MDVSFDIQITGSEDPDPWLDDYETSQMLDHTRGQLERHVHRALDGMICPEHGDAPRVQIAGTYDAEAEQLDIHYNVDTCCQPFLMRCITALNRR